MYSQIVENVASSDLKIVQYDRIRCSISQLITVHMRNPQATIDSYLAFTKAIDSRSPINVWFFAKKKYAKTFLSRGKPLDKVFRLETVRGLYVVKTVGKAGSLRLYPDGMTETDLASFGTENDD